MKPRMIRAGTAKRSRKRLKNLRASLFAAAAVLACVLFVLIYGTGALTWEEVFSLVGVQPGTAQSADNSAEPSNAAGTAGHTNIRPAAEGTLSVTFLSVGQGDAALIETPSLVILIDGGDTYAGKELCETLRERGIERLDYVFSTHPHRDHFGGLIEVFRVFEVGRLYITEWPQDETPTNTSFLEFLQVITEREIDTWVAATGERIDLDTGALTVLSAGGFSDLNECSLVIRLTYGETSFLFMGDAGFQTENYLMDSGLLSECDVLKAGHHGSRYATGEEFLAAVDPAFVVASCGADNRYGYPTPEVVERVNHAGANLLRTDLDGNVCFVSDGSALRLETEKEREAA